MISRDDLKQEVIKWANEIGVQFKEIQIRRMTRKWGSCSGKGRLTLNEALLNEPKEIRDHVIVHELLHLRYPNHGKMFKVMLNAYLS